MLEQPHRVASHLEELAQDIEEPEAERHLAGQQVGDADHLRVEVQRDAIPLRCRPAAEEHAGVALKLEVGDDRVVGVQPLDHIEPGAEGEAAPHQPASQQRRECALLIVHHLDGHLGQGVCQPLVPLPLPREHCRPAHDAPVEHEPVGSPDGERGQPSRIRNAAPRRNPLEEVGDYLGVGVERGHEPGLDMRREQVEVLPAGAAEVCQPGRVEVDVLRKLLPGDGRHGQQHDENQ